MLAAVTTVAALAAGPAGAAAAVKGTAATREVAGTSVAAVRPVPGWMARLRPGSPGVLPWARGTAKGAGTTSQQAHAAAASSSTFSGADLYGVSCTGRKECTATGLAATRTGKN